MPRPTKTGAPARAARRQRLIEMLVQRTRAEETAFNIWDTKQAGLVLRIQPSGKRAYKAVYRHHGRPRWLHLGDARAIGLADARQLAARAMLRAADGKDPAAERKAERSAGTFQELADRYLEGHAKRKNKSWQQGRYLVERHVLPRWGKLQAASIARSDVAVLMTKIEAPVVANQTLAAASAIFSWGIKQEIVAINPCKLVDRNETHSRERVLSDSEVALFWREFDSAGLVAGSALRLILLTGQRPGEVAHMRHEHIVDGWWTMPGGPDPKTGWPGTKNGESHRVWLSEAARSVLAEVSTEASGFAFAGERGKPIGKLDGFMRLISKALGVSEKVTPHDLRRTHGTTVTKLKFGRDAMNRVQNHKEGGIADVYDRHDYADENKRVMEAVASHIVALAEGRQDGGNVVEFGRR